MADTAPALRRLLRKEQAEVARLYEENESLQLNRDMVMHTLMEILEIDGHILSATSLDAVQALVEWEIKQCNTKSDKTEG